MDVAPSGKLELTWTNKHLRLLADEVTGRRFQWPGLRLIGEAQWRIEDYDGARRTWERVRANALDDLDANFALANVYERRYRKEKKPEFFEASKQAIARVVGNPRATTRQRAEAMALEGRNYKTQWRLDFEDLPDLPMRREKATNRSLRKAYESYRNVVPRGVV